MPSANSENIRTASIELTVLGTHVKATIPLPDGYVRPTELLPIFQGLADIITDIATEKAQKEGQTLSCKMGCGACCRQLVPISEVEKYRLRDIIAAMPELRRTEIRRRFANAEQALDAAGLMEKLEHINALNRDDGHQLGREYFQLRIACPFLENESCSIHAVRPIVCREYLVSSPAEYCDSPTAGIVVTIPVPHSVSHTVARIGHATDERPEIVPLSLIFRDKDSGDIAPVHAATALETAFRTMGKEEKSGKQA